jgi:hypothetical protein
LPTVRNCHERFCAARFLASLSNCWPSPRRFRSARSAAKKRVCHGVQVCKTGPWSSILRSDVHITKFVLLIVCRSHCPWPGLTMHVKDFVKAKSGAERAFGSRSDTIDCILPHATSSMTCTLPAKFEPNLVSSQRCRQKVRRCESS